jgi:hypothetical protein
MNPGAGGSGKGWVPSREREGVLTCQWATESPHASSFQTEQQVRPHERQ